MRRLHKVNPTTRIRTVLQPLTWLVAVLLTIGYPDRTYASEQYVPDRTGISLNTGYTYDPSDDICFMQVSFFKLYDYDDIWKHSAPDSLRFKVEGSVGGARLKNDHLRASAGAGILALLYLDRFQSDTFIPYIEAGIGVTYTDYRVTGQDYRFNFNPQAGLGLEFKNNQAGNPFIAVRAHHVSNGGIGSSNRGLNSVVLMFGRYF